MNELVYDAAVGDVVSLDYARRRTVLAWTRGMTAEQWERVALHLRRCERLGSLRQKRATRGCDVCSDGEEM
jgi:hypothetical protein